MSGGRENREALEYFVAQLRDGKLEYRDGELWRHWEPRRGWLEKPKRAEKLCPNGYYILRTVQKCHAKSYYAMAHRVIWSFFHGLISEGMEVNHKNGVKRDNKIDNLEEATRLENELHAKEHGLLKPARGLDSGRGKLSDDDVREIRVMHATGQYLQREIALKFSVRPNQISRIVNGKRKAYINFGESHA
jgi:hypothetical protein